MNQETTISALGHYSVKKNPVKEYRGFAYTKRGAYYTVRKIMEKMPTMTHKSCPAPTNLLYKNVSSIKRELDEWYNEVNKERLPSI